jgi:2-phospho-L-lactate guanylyltransferase (CobY/MobA/RfbA family)
MTTVQPTSSPSRIAAIVPVGTLEGAKTRLGETLDAEERLDLAERLLTRTIDAALAVERLADVLVISPDREVLRRASDLGARTSAAVGGLMPGSRRLADVIAAARTPSGPADRPRLRQRPRSRRS